jgi:trk system potassium uptake protein TrkH
MLVTALFQAVSILTTTGFGTVDYQLWPPAAQAIILLLMFGGGCVGSTAGSIKMQRYLLLGKSLWQQMIGSFRPQQLLPTRINGQTIEESDRRSALFYIAFSFLFMTFAVPFLGLLEPASDLATVGSAVVTCFTNVGPGFGAVGPSGNFAAFGPAAHLLLAFLMILGRLEMFAVLALFVPALWRRY